MSIKRGRFYMKDKWLKRSKFILLVVLSFLFVAQLFYQPSNVAEAAAKPSITKSMTIPIGKLDDNVQWNKNSYEIVKAQKLTVKNKVKGATYTFKSSDTKIATIDKDGGYITGNKAGSATITCTQKYKNKTTTVGTCKVTVKKTVMKLNEYAESVFAVGSNGYKLYDFYASMEPIYHIEYRNPNASYTLTSDSKDFTIKEVKYDASSAKKATKDSAFVEELENFMGDRYFYGYEFNTKKAGIYKVTVKETYNKKTTTLGSFKVEIKETSLVETHMDVLLGERYHAYYRLTFPKTDTRYYFAVENADKVLENNPIIIEEIEDIIVIYANKAGKSEVSVREGSKDGKLIGTINFVVTELPCKEINLRKTEYSAYEGDDFFWIYFDLNPWSTTDKLTISSDNTDVLKVKFNIEYNEWEYQVGKAGKAIVTIKCGDQSAEVTVIVEVEKEDDYDEDEDW